FPTHWSRLLVRLHGMARNGEWYGGNYLTVDNCCTYSIRAARRCNHSPAVMRRRGESCCSAALAGPSLIRTARGAIAVLSCASSASSSLSSLITGVSLDRGEVPDCLYRWGVVLDPGRRCDARCYPFLWSFVCGTQDRGHRQAGSGAVPLMDQAGSAF